MEKPTEKTAEEILKELDLWADYLKQSRIEERRDLHFIKAIKQKANEPELMEC